MATKKVELSTAELEEMLAERKKEERAEAEAKRLAYETERNDLVMIATHAARVLNNNITDFKKSVMADMRKWLERMREYGDAKEEQQNFQLISADGNLKVVYTNHMSKGFDERSKIAEEKLKKFLNGFVKKRDQGLYQLILGLLERNSINGDLDISNINRLYKMENDFDDEDWRQAITLFKESYNEVGSKNYLRFFERDENGSWKAIVIDFASV